MIAKMYFDISHLRFDRKATASINKGLLFISNVEETRAKYCSGRLQQEYGNSINRHIPNSVFGYADIQLSGDGIISSETFHETYLKEFNDIARHLEALLVFLWFIEDNNIGVYGTYGEIPELKLVNGKSRSIVSYSCDGNLKESTFSERQIQEAGELVTKYNSISGLTNKVSDDTNILYEYNDLNIASKGIIPKAAQGFSYHNQNRIDKAINFLQTARGQNYLFYKIAYYVPIFECLFNTKSSEIQQRIAQRAAFYIGENPQERKDIFDIIIEGYSYRSKFIHGGNFSNETDLDKNTLTPLAIALDKYLRKILVKAIREDHELFIDFPNELMDKVFDSIILGLPVNMNELKEESRKRNQQRLDSLAKAEAKKERGKVHNKNS